MSYTLAVAALALAAFAAALVLTWIVLRVASVRGMLDMPNSRSSHVNPTPRGGGVAIGIATTAAVLVLGALGIIDRDLLFALTGGGVVIALIGFIDDHRPLPAAPRLAVHLCAAVWAIAWLGGPVAAGLGVSSAWLLAGCAAIALLGIAWSVNLFNFMDGIDGIAASEAIFVAGAGLVLCTVSARSVGVASAAAVFLSACLGFLVWNWAPARIFLGDVGSGYIGYVIAVLALADARTRPAALLTWVILAGSFVADASVTLARRLLRLERISQAHRTHAYQWLARRWGSHARATVAITAVNVLWLLPWACLATLYPDRASWDTIGALVPLMLVAFLTGAGRRES